MHIVVNRFRLREDVDWPVLQSEVDRFHARVSRQREDLRGVSLVRVGDAEAIFLVLFETREALDDISRNIAAPWFAQHVRPFLAGPVDRQVGEIVAGPLK